MRGQPVSLLWAPLAALLLVACAREAACQADGTGPPCSSSFGCGSRQECLGGRCYCPVHWGIVDMPACSKATTATRWLLAYSYALALLLLGTAGLHVATIYHHLTSQPHGQLGLSSLRSSSTKVQPTASLRGSGGERTSSTRWTLTQSQLSGSLLSRLLSYKVLFCLCSLVFLLAWLPSLASLSLFTLQPSASLRFLSTERASMPSITAQVGLASVTWSYLLMGRICLGLAPHFNSEHLVAFAASRLSGALLLVPGLLVLLPCLWIARASPDSPTRLSLHVAAASVSALLAVGFTALSIAVLQPFHPVHNLERSVHPGEGAAGEPVVGRWEEGAAMDRSTSPLVEQTREQSGRSKIVMVLREKRKALFRPLLEPITELESSACETSASRSILTDSNSGSGSRLSEGDRMADVGDDEQPPVVEEDGQASPPGVGRPAATAEAEAPTARPTLPPLGRPPVANPAGQQQANRTTRGSGNPAAAAMPLRRTLVSLARSTSATAFRVARVNATCSMLTLVHLALVRRPVQDPVVGVVIGLLGLLALPTMHVWGNLFCLLAVSTTARSAVQRLYAHALKGLDWVLLFFIALCGCSLESGDVDRAMGVGSSVGASAASEKLAGVDEAMLSTR